MSASAGRVLLMPKGDYDTTVTYKPLDIVKYGVSSYVCILQTQGNVPTNATYWQVLAEGIANVTPEELGIGYGIASGSGADRTATLTDYELVTNGIVAVTFAVDVPANATLNINSEGAKPIYFRGSAIVANVIKGGDTVTFAYDGTRYNVLCIDGGAGHKLLKADGTELPQRDALQASDGLEFVDDSTNQRTKVKMNLPIVSFEDWNAMTEQEQTAYKASHYRFGVELPDTEGVINAEYMTKLWENPNTSASFVGQTVTLSSADYDFLMILAATTNGANVQGFITNKTSGYIQFSLGNNNGAVTRYRAVTISGISVTFADAQQAVSGSVTTDNTRCIPVAVYGIKTSVQFKVNAIASNLSTRADHCFLDDETTTVEDALTYKDVYSTTEHIVGKWIDGSDLYEKTINYTTGLPSNSSVDIPLDITNLKEVIEASIMTSNGSTAFPIPYYDGTNRINYLIRENTGKITLTTNSASYTGYNKTKITLRYTKTS